MAPRRRTLTLEVLNEMRQRAKATSDPAAQLEYAKALIEAAVTFGNEDPDPKRQKRNKEALFLEGLKIIKRLATTGMGIGKPAYPEAQFFLANCYGNGSLGLQIDHDKAFNLYIQASKQNHPASTYRTAVCYEIGAGTKRDHSRAVQFYRKAAALGDPAGMYKLGMVVLKGMLGLQSNPREAISWLKRAADIADEDNPHALHELGLCFEKAGIPTVIPDESYSRELFTKAAGFGYAPSQFKLGHCYEYGALTCPVDPRRSIAWYTRAAEQGDAESELGLSGWYLTGAEGVLKQSDTEAYLWARKAADKGLARAEYAVGYYSEVGIGVKQDLEESRRWYLRSAAQGNNRAKKRLVDMKKLGAMRRVRHDRARQAGQQGPDDENCKVM
ncbi:MAG: HCP-like protein [Linnemannia gamsii]|nr:MAG: HCP-like protein [Linnemannia gamsii]